MGALTKCKTCGKEVAKSAKTCPSCGEKLKMGLFAKLVLTMFILVVLVVVAITLTRKSPEMRAEKTAAAVQDLSKMTPVTMDFESASLEAQIKEKKGSAILVTTIIQKVEKLENRYKISAMLGGAGMNVKGVFFYLYPKTPQDDQTIASLKTMDQIKVKGIISGTMVGNIVLDPAILASDTSTQNPAQAPTASPTTAPAASGAPPGQVQAVPANPQPDQSAKSSGDAQTKVDECVSAKIAAFRKERGQEAMVRKDMLDEWTEDCTAPSK